MSSGAQVAVRGLTFPTSHRQAPGQNELRPSLPEKLGPRGPNLGKVGDGEGWGRGKGGAAFRPVVGPLFPHSAPGCHRPDGHSTPPTQETQASFSGEEDLLSGTPRKRPASHQALLGSHKALLVLLVHVEGQPRNSTHPPPAPKGKDQIIQKCWKNGDKAGSLGMPPPKCPLKSQSPER